MKKELLKKELIFYLSLFFDIEENVVEKYFQNYKIIKNDVKIKLRFYPNIKIEIWITNHNKKIMKKRRKKELIIIRIKNKNDKLLDLKRIDNISYYTFDVVTGIKIIPRNKKEENLKKLAFLYLNLKPNSFKNHDIIKRRRHLWL